MKFKSLPTPTQESRFRQSLQVIPMHNAAARVIPGDNPDECEIEIQLTYRGAFMSLLQKALKLHRTKRYVLDAIGSRVYTSVDGEKTFEQIIDTFAEREKLSFFESRALLGQYFQTLTRRGIIVATLPK